MNIPNKETIKAMLDARAGKTLKAKSIKDLLNVLADELEESNKQARKALDKAKRSLDKTLKQLKNI
jgi:hypothetical protein